MKIHCGGCGHKFDEYQMFFTGRVADRHGRTIDERVCARCLEDHRYTKTVDERLLQKIENTLRHIVHLIEKASTDPRNGHFDIHVVRVGTEPQEPPMNPVIDHSPKLQLPSENFSAVLAVTGAKLPDGTYVKSENVTWKTSDPTNLALEAVADDVDRYGADDPNGTEGEPRLDEAGLEVPVFRTKVLTPGDSGDGFITISAQGMADCDIEITYSPVPVGHFVIMPSVMPD